MSKPNTLKNKTITGLLWTMLDFLSNQGIQFIIQIVLARLLTPRDFGIIGMITVFIAVSQTIADSGFSNALIREKNPSQADYSTVFYFNLLISIILYFILYFLAPPISEFYNEPQLINILRVLAIVILINSFGLIQQTILIRHINFKTQTIVKVISSIISGLFAIILAYKGLGVWSLVVRTIAMQLIQSLLFTFLNKWKPSFVFSIASFRRLFGFGSRLLASDILNTLYNNVYYLIIGKAYSPVELGFYTNAQKIRDAASNSITMSVQKVSYPVLSTMQDENKRLKNAYQKIIKNAVYLTFPVMIGLASVANPLFNVLLGKMWEDSIVYFQILCLAGMLFPLHAINLNILKVKGRSDLFLKLEILKKSISLLFVFFVLFFKLGLLTLLWTAVLNSCIAFFINSYYTKSLLDYSTTNQIRDVIPALLISFFMGIIVSLIGEFMPNKDIIILIGQVIAGIIIYIILSKLFKIKEIDTIYGMLKSFKKTSKAR